MTIRGFRLDSRDNKPDKDREFNHLLPKRKTQEKLDALQEVVNEDNKLTTPERNCFGLSAKFTNYDDPRNLYNPPTDEEAVSMCSGCPLLKLCGDYATAAKPEWGVWAGKVYGRDLEDD